ncbi:alpha/beta fold hydrolase [Methylosoma difficile]
MTNLALAFEELGNPSQPPLLIVHGFFASSRNWRLMAEKLAAHFHVYVLDMRNHGASPQHPQMDYPVMTADVLAFLDRHGLDCVSLIGHSMGGKIAMWFALHYPHRIDRLVVADIAPVSYQHSFDNTINALASLPLADISNRKQAEIWLAEGIPDLSYRQFLLQNLVLQEGSYRWRVNLDIFQQTAANIVAFPDTYGLLPFYGHALFIAGADSGYVNAEDLEELFPTAQLEYLADAGHWLHVQQPAAFYQRVMGFLLG